MQLQDDQASRFAKVRLGRAASASRFVALGEAYLGAAKRGAALLFAGPGRAARSWMSAIDARYTGEARRNADRSLRTRGLWMWRFSGVMAEMIA